MELAALFALLVMVFCIGVVVGFILAVKAKIEIERLDNFTL